MTSKKGYFETPALFHLLWRTYFSHSHKRWNDRDLVESVNGNVICLLGAVILHALVQ
jgi:hypothetical protein